MNCIRLYISTSDSHSWAGSFQPIRVSSPVMLANLDHPKYKDGTVKKNIDFKASSRSDMIKINMFHRIPTTSPLGLV